MIVMAYATKSQNAAAAEEMIKDQDDASGTSNSGNAVGDFTSGNVTSRQRRCRHLSSQK